MIVNRTVRQRLPRERSRYACEGDMLNFRQRLATGLAWLLAAFFLFGAWGNVFLSPDNAASYARWGYPDWFHYVTALLELVAALLLLWARTRVWGAGLGVLVMGAASLTTLVHGEHGHAVAPTVILAVSATMLALSLSRSYRLTRV